MSGHSDKIPAEAGGTRPEGHTFRKGERLSGRKTIARLFQEGRTLQTSLFTIYFCECDVAEFPARVAISVPRRIFKKAVTRNLLKRRIREAYRLCKPEFYARLQKQEKQVCLMIIYRRRIVSDFRSIRSALPGALDLLAREIET